MKRMTLLQISGQCKFLNGMAKDIPNVLPTSALKFIK